jgi:hypothetical protein
MPDRPRGVRKRLLQEVRELCKSRYDLRPPASVSRASQPGEGRWYIEVFNGYSMGIA